MLLLSLSIFLFASLTNALPMHNYENQVLDFRQQKAIDESVTEKIARVNSDNRLHLFEGDIYLEKEDKTSMRGDNEDAKISGERMRRNVHRDRQTLWPRREIPYEIHSSIPVSYHTTIQSAMNVFHSQTCLRFRLKNTNDSNWVVFIHKTGCWSTVGRKYWRVNYGQELSLGPSCNDKATIMHELMHAAGFWHEHSRTDRNQYVEVLWENIAEDQAFNFVKYSHDMMDDLQLPYDYTSLMHYGRKQFSKNGLDTIRDLHDPNKPLGQTTGFSSNDVHEINTLYDCKCEYVYPQGRGEYKCSNNTKSSIVSSGWSPWSSYGACNINCKKQRQRYCFADNPVVDCPGNHQYNVENEVVNCTNQECYATVDGHWGRWSPWNNCSQPCGPGTRTRTRKCDDPPPKYGGKDCIGNSTVTEDCYLRRCGLGQDDCQFDYDGFCFWNNDVSNPSGFDWLRRSGPTPSRSTGPTADHTNGQDHYLYIEASSPAQSGYKARLFSKTFPSTTGQCLTFWYHMWGSSMGQLNLYTRTKGGGLSKIWSRSGDQGNSWNEGQVSLFINEQYEIVFEGVRGTSFNSDIAIDDVQFTEKPCTEELGCFNDGSPKAFPELVKNLRNDIDWYNMRKTIDDCAKVVHHKGYKIFAIQYYGECWSSSDPSIQYDKYGKATGQNDCWSGVGGPHKNYVYRFLG